MKNHVIPACGNYLNCTVEIFAQGAKRRYAKSPLYALSRPRIKELGILKQLFVGGKAMEIRMENYMKLEIPAKSCNEGFVRATVAAFAVQLDLSIEEMADIKTAVSEAVTNSIVHGYADMKGVVTIICRIADNAIEIEISDNGVGIEDIDKAMQPLYTSRPDCDRSGMGFTVMQTFMDELEVRSEVGEGTTVVMRKCVMAEKSVLV